MTVPALERRRLDRTILSGINPIASVKQNSAHKVAKRGFIVRYENVMTRMLLALLRPYRRPNIILTHEGDCGSTRVAQGWNCGRQFRARREKGDFTVCNLGNN